MEVGEQMEVVKVVEAMEIVMVVMVGMKQPFQSLLKDPTFSEAVGNVIT